LEEQITKLDGEAAELLQAHQGTIQRLADAPGLGVSSAVQTIAEAGPGAEAFESAKEMSSWVGVCPESNETAGEARKHDLASGQSEHAAVAEPSGAGSG